MSADAAVIFPRATGPAAEVVAAHQVPQDLVFYSGWFCPFVQRSWICLEEKGVPYQYEEVNPYKREPHFLAINPKGLVPALEYKGRALYESLVICEFIEEAFPRYGRRLLPQDPLERGVARVWMDHLTKSFVPAFHRLLQSQDIEKQDASRQEVYDALKRFSWAIKGPFFLGEEFSMVDAVIAPWIVRDGVIRDHRGYRREAVSVKWTNYCAAVERRPSVVNTLSLSEHMSPIWARYLRDEAQSEGAKAIRAGKVMP